MKVKVGIRHQLNKYWLLLCLLFPFCKGGDKILLPIKGGYMYENKHGYSQGTSLTIFPSSNYKVRAIEDSYIKAIYELDSTYTIFANGKYSTAYGNLDTFFIQKNEKIKKGQIIGQIKMDSGSRLDFNLERNGVPVISKASFKSN